MVPYVVVALASLIVAAVMSGVAWRVVREERRRSEARVRALAAAIASEKGSGVFFASGAEQDSRPLFHVPDLELRPPAAAPGALFAVTDRPPSSRAPAAIALGVFAVASAAALAVALSAGSRTAPPAPAASAAAVAEAPIELVALGHDRDGDRLTVRGVVRNPRGAAAVNQLAAVVFVFNHDGGFVASARGAVDAPVLATDAESTFIVQVTGITDIGRYRVSFRTDDRIVPHVDRRTAADSRLKAQGSRLETKN